VPGDFRPAPQAVVPVTPSDRIAEALERGDGAQAARWYFGLPVEQTRRLLEPRTSLQLARWLAEQRQAQAALVLYQRHLRDFPRGPGRAEAHLGAGLVQLYLLDQPASAYQHLVDALGSEPDPGTALRTRQALEDIATRQKRQVERWQR
jgi:tetratricopeptide (TPR) repeat protein